jgi:hypothetical protein
MQWNEIKWCIWKPLGTGWSIAAGATLVIRMGLIEPVKNTDHSLHVRLNREEYLLNLTQTSKFQNNNKNCSSQDTRTTQVAVFWAVQVPQTWVCLIWGATYQTKSFRSALSGDLILQWTEQMTHSLKLFGRVVFLVSFGGYFKSALPNRPLRWNQILFTTPTATTDINHHSSSRNRHLVRISAVQIASCFFLKHRFVLIHAYSHNIYYRAFGRNCT